MNSTNEKAKDIFNFYYGFIPYTHTNKQRYEVAMKGCKWHVNQILLIDGVDSEYWQDVLIQLDTIQ